MTKHGSRKLKGEKSSRHNAARIMAMYALKYKQAEQKKSQEIAMIPGTEIMVQTDLDPEGKDFSMFRPENRFQGLDLSRLHKMLEKPAVPDMDTGVPVLDRYIVSFVTGEPLSEKDKKHLMDPSISANPVLREGRVNLFQDTGIPPVTLADAQEIGIGFLRSKEQ